MTYQLYLSLIPSEQLNDDENIIIDDKIMTRTSYLMIKL